MEIVHNRNVFPNFLLYVRVREREREKFWRVEKYFFNENKTVTTEREKKDCIIVEQ